MLMSHYLAHHSNLPFIVGILEAYEVGIEPQHE